MPVTSERMLDLLACANSARFGFSPVNRTAAFYPVCIRRTEELNGRN